MTLRKKSGGEGNIIRRRMAIRTQPAINRNGMTWDFPMDRSLQWVYKLILFMMWEIFSERSRKATMSR
jgi:hypothetical protein